MSHFTRDRHCICCYRTVACNCLQVAFFFRFSQEFFQNTISWQAFSFVETHPLFCMQAIIPVKATLPRANLHMSVRRSVIGQMLPLPASSLYITLCTCFQCTTPLNLRRPYSKIHLTSNTSEVMLPCTLYVSSPSQLPLKKVLFLHIRENASMQRGVQSPTATTLQQQHCLCTPTTS